MLDKSIPYKSIYMKRADTKTLPVNPVALPEGFRFAFYRPGDEKQWADIHVSVLHFADTGAALERFARTYLPYEAQAEKRCLFVAAPSGEAVATASAWFTPEPFPRAGLIHWVAVKPEFQGRGIGKAIVGKALSLFDELENGREIWLHTQTWSHKAIGLYLDLGFCAARFTSFDGKANEYAEAAEILNGNMSPKWYQRLIETTVP